MIRRRDAYTPECKAGWGKGLESRRINCFSFESHGEANSFPLTNNGREDSSETVIEQGLYLLITKVFSVHRGEYFEPFKQQMLAHLQTGEPVEVGDNNTIDEAYLDNDGCEVVIVIVSSEEANFRQSDTKIYKPIIKIEIPKSGPEGEPVFSPDAVVNLREIEARFNT